jgi:hypothetical protein
MPSLRSHLLTFVLGGLLGTAAGGAGMLIAFPYLFPPAPANDAAPGLAATTATSAATFQFDEKAPGRDRVHWADGNGTVLKTDAGWVLRLEGDFKAGPGPNYWIYLNTRPVGRNNEFTADSGRVRLAKLRSFEGAQNYALPAGVDPTTFHTVTIWCESFSQYIGSGALRRRGPAAAAAAAAAG